jgi:hypothetical protein
MSDAEDSSLFFTDGYVVSKNSVVIPAQYNAFPTDPMSRVMFMFGSEWIHYDVDDDMIRSVSMRVSDSTCYLLGKNGTVVTCGGGGKVFSEKSLEGSFRKTKIQDVEKYGELFRLRVIADVPYACGQRGQIYTETSGGWEHADQGVFAKKAPTLEDIDGTGARDIYAVGMHGTVVHYDGRRWRTVDVGTNQHLSNVRCLTTGDVFMCGNSGVVIRRSGRGWELIDNPLGEPHYWGMDVYRGKVYLAHVNGMHVFDGKAITELDFGLGKEVSCHRVHSNEDVLWSFGVDDLFKFNGRKWREVICPENE